MEPRLLASKTSLSELVLMKPCLQDTKLPRLAGIDYLHCNLTLLALRQDDSRLYLPEKWGPPNPWFAYHSPSLPYCQCQSGSPYLQYTLSYAVRQLVTSDPLHLYATITDRMRGPRREWLPTSSTGFLPKYHCPFTPQEIRQKQVLQPWV